MSVRGVSKTFFNLSLGTSPNPSACCRRPVSAALQVSGAIEHDYDAACGAEGFEAFHSVLLDAEIDFGCGP